jgi:RND family efflux transporter MFP subunit
MKLSKRFSLLAGLGVAAIAGSIGLALFPTQESQHPISNRHTVLPVQTTAVRSQSAFELRRVFSGRVQARRDSLLGFDRAGLLAVVHVDEGAVVSRGKLLAEIDTERLSAQQAELQAQLAQAQANRALTRATLLRRQGVVEAGGVSRQTLDEAREDLRVAEANLDLVRRRLESLDVEFAKARLIAPFDGTIVARLADEGRVLDAGAPVLRLQSSAMPEIRIGIAGRAVEALQVGGTYNLHWQTSLLRARLRTLLPLRSAGARTVDALLDPIDVPVGLRPGDLATLHFSTSVAADGVWLPITALAEGERGLWSVYVTESAGDAETPPGLAASHRIARRTVDLIYQEADRVYVRGTLAPNERVVTSGLQRVVPGQWVRLEQHLAGTPQ